MVVAQGASHGVLTPSSVPQDRVFTGHRVTTPVFAGPIDLLIYLVQRNEIDVFSFAVKAITADYLAYLEGMAERDIEEIGEFMVMAAWLMEIKSARLLPPAPRQQGEEQEDEESDPRAQLLARLLEYRRFRRVAEELRERLERQRWVFSRALLANGNGEGADRRHVVLAEVSPFDLWAAFQAVLSRVKERRPQGEVTRPRFTVPQKMAVVAARVRWARDGIRFSELFDEDATLMEVIVTFLAILELIRLQRIRVVQEGLFGEIRVYAWAESEAA